MFKEFISDAEFRTNLSNRKDTLLSFDFFTTLTDRARVSSEVYKRSRHNTTSSDRIIQPSLKAKKILEGEGKLKASDVEWPTGEFENSNVKTYISKTDLNPDNDSETPVTEPEKRIYEDQYSQIIIPMVFKVVSIDVPQDILEQDNDYYLYEYILNASVQELADVMDNHIIHDHRNSFLNKAILNGFSGSHMFTHVSKDMGTVAGHIPTPELSYESVITALFHLPQGYRSRATWIMNENTAKIVAKLESEDGTCIAENINEDGTPRIVAKKPVLINNQMPDISNGNIPIIISDLSRGYITGKSQGGYMHIINDGYNLIVETILTMAGSILQPAAFKSVKIVEEEKLSVEI